jgi:hypothetical protein
MHTVLRVGVLLLFALAVLGSAWYIAFRLRTAFGLQRRWPLRVLVMAALVGSFVLMGARRSPLMWSPACRTSLADICSLATSS